MDRKIERKRGFQKKHFKIIGILAGIIALGWFVLSAYAVKKQKVETNELTISTVKMGAFDDYVAVNGAISPISTIYIDAYEGGRVTEKLIEEGAMVKRGDVILKLENRQLLEQILNSENNLALKQNDLRSTKLTFDARQNQGEKELLNASYELKKLKRKFEQNKTLFEEGFLPEEDFKVAEEDYELSKKRYEIIKKQVENDNALRANSLKELEFDLARMRKTLSMVYERLDQLNVKAPADGQLGFLDAEVGQNINQGVRIGQVNVLTDFKVEAYIDEHYIDRVRRGLVATISKSNKTYELQLRKVYPEVRDRGFKVDFVFTGERMEQIRTGQSHQLKLQLGEPRNTLLLPKGRFFQRTGGQWVYVLNSTGDKATKKKITIGKQNTTYYEVMSGLSEGDQVITSDYDYFGDSEQLIID